jgi:hypothetical protein
MVKIEDENALIEAIKDVRADSTETNWVLAGHVEGNLDTVRLVGSGKGGVDELVSRLDPATVQYGLVRSTEKFDLSTTVKFVYIYFVGTNVPALQRGKIGTAHGEVKKHFSPFHIDFEITDPGEIDNTLIEKKLAENSGKVNNVKDVSYDGNTHERGFTGTSTKAQSGPKKSNFGFQGQSSETKTGAAIAASGDVTNAIADVRSDKSETNWLVTAYEDNDTKKPLKLVASGNGGVDELINHLTTDLIAYVFIRVIDIIEGIKTVKFAFITFIGPDVSIMKKAKVATNKGGVTALFAPSHVTLEISSPNEISDEILLSTIQDASGSKSKVK